jgi:hypothetical protein
LGQAKSEISDFQKKFADRSNGYFLNSSGACEKRLERAKKGRDEGPSPSSEASSVTDHCTGLWGAY